jgi:hypothetical protein
MIIRKTPARQHGLNEPFRHENHPRPITRRQLLGAGFLSGPAMVLAPAWLGSLLKPQSASALDATIQQMQAECKIQGSGGAAAGPLPFIVIDLAGGANLMGSEALAGVKGGQMNFLSTAGYAKLGLPGAMIPTSTTFIDTSLGMAFHSDSAILRGIKTRAQAATLAGVNGVVIPAMSQNDTGNNPLNPMYGIAKAAAGGAGKQYGSLLTLVGTQSSTSGGNSASPASTSVGGSDPTLTPTKIASAADDTGLVSSSGNAPNPDTLAALASQARISSGATAQASVTTPAEAAFSNSPLGSTLIQGNTAADAALKEQVRCAFVKTAYTADSFGSPSTLNPDLDTNIVAASGAIFTTAEYQADANIRKAAAVMKLVLNGYAGAGTITLGGYDYHSGNRADGEVKNQAAGVIIGAILDYARRVNRPVMIQVISDGSLTATNTVDSSTNGRGKLGWQGDSQQVAASLLLAYSPKGRPAMSPSVPGNQIGFLNADGTVNATSSPAANANNLLVQTVMLNWMAANGTVADFATVFPTQGLGAVAARDLLTAFTQIT